MEATKIISNNLFNIQNFFNIILGFYSWVFPELDGKQTEKKIFHQYMDITYPCQISGIEAANFFIRIEINLLTFESPSISIFKTSFPITSEFEFVQKSRKGMKF